MPKNISFTGTTFLSQSLGSDEGGCPGTKPGARLLSFQFKR